MEDGTGGGKSYNGYGGGGSSDIRMVKGEAEDIESLLSRILVAAGGGGNSKKTEDNRSGIGGNGGDLTNGEDGSVATGVSGSGYFGKGANASSVLVGYDIYAVGVEEAKNISILEKGSLGKGGSVDYDGAGAGGSGYFGGSAAHNEYAGGGSGISYIYKGAEATSIVTDEDGNSYKYPFNTSVAVEYKSIIEKSDNLRELLKTSNSGTWKNIEYKTASGIVKKGNTNMPNPLKYLGSSEVTGNSDNGYVVIKKIS